MAKATQAGERELLFPAPVADPEHIHDGQHGAGSKERSLSSRRCVAMAVLCGMMAGAAMMLAKERKVATIPPGSTSSEYEQVSKLSFSFRVDSGAPFLVSPSRRIFKDEENDVAQTTMSEVNTETVFSESSQDYAQKIAAKLGISGGGGWGPSSLSAAAEASMQSTSSSHHKQLRQDVFTRVKHVKIVRNAAFSQDSLTDDFKKLLVDRPVEEIHSLMGDFFTDEVTLGGVYQLTSFVEELATDNSAKLKAKLEGSYKSVAVHAKGSMSSGASLSTSIGGRQAHSKMTVLGGNPNIWMGLQEENHDDIQAKWAQSIEQNNEYPVEVRLRPLWELLSNHPQKADQLKKHMVNTWKKMSDGLPEYSAVPESYAVPSTTQADTVIDYSHFRSPSSRHQD